jgi:beta-galactosidase
MFTPYKFRIKLFTLLVSILLLTQSCDYNDNENSIGFEPIEAMYNYNVHDRLFDANWKFLKGEVKGGEDPSFDDSEWRTLDLPHDWSIEDLDLSKDQFQDVSPTPKGPFSPDSPGDISTGYVLGGVGWYRKHFTLQPQEIGKIVKITFDGVYMNADAWINGKYLGNHPYGYTAFIYDITPYLKVDGSENVLSVKVVNEGRNSRWYSGSGIYRHTWLSITDPLHLDRWGIYATTPQVGEDKATVKIDASVINYFDHSKEFIIETLILDPNGKEVFKNKQNEVLESGITGLFKGSYPVESPKLWSLENPNLYLAKINLILDGKIVDQLSTTFGIRTIDFSIDKGFQLNGETILIKGGNMHHDNGPLGAASIDRAEYRRVELMKSFGYNGIRTSHNPPSRQFLDACDKLGILVMDESFDQWQRPKNPKDYNLYFDDWWEKDIESMVLRDRNHPSVIIWSIGNEINERGDSSGLHLTKVLKEKVKSLDQSRPVTAGICSFWEFPGRPWEDTEPSFALLDVAGYNYQWKRYEDDHIEFPERIIIGTESIAGDAFDNWHLVEKYPWIIGDFLWTSMDYLGEAGIGNALLDNEKKEWPWFNAYCGDIDLCGFKKPQSYYRDVVWGISDLEIAVHAPLPKGRNEIVSFWGWPDELQSWNWEGYEGEDMSVSVYTSCDSVILEVNGDRAGMVDLKDSVRLKTNIYVKYQPGELKAIGFKNGSLVETQSIKTTGKAHSIRLSADRMQIKADRNDLAYISVEVVDEFGSRIPDAEVPIEFQIEGNGELVGVGNGNPKDIKSFQKPECTTFRGRCLLIIRPMNSENGEIRILAKAKGLIESDISVIVKNKMVL